MTGSLDGVRVLDFSHALAGPYCTLILSYYGAAIYKVESPNGGDIGRAWGPPFRNGESCFFLGLNAGKRGLAIDLKRPDGVDLCLRLIERSDVLVENFRPGTMERLGLGYAAAAARNPRLVYCSISGYGQAGPSAGEPAMDLILQASSGLMSFTGTPDGQLVRCGHSVADITAGMFAVIGILLALRSRGATGVGQYVDVSMLDGMISAMASAFANYHGSLVSPKPMGSAFATIVPYRAYPTADRELVIAIGSERLWPIFCEAIHRPDLSSHPDYATNAARVSNREKLEEIIMSALKIRGAAEWSDIFTPKGIPHAPIRTLEEVAHDPQVAFRGMFQTVHHGAAGPFSVTGVPVKMSGTPGSVGGGAPRLGEHTEPTLAALLGLRSDELERLRACGAISVPPA